jgi:hypothetical protein
VVGYGLDALSKLLFALAPSIGVVMTARVMDRIGKGIRGAPRDALVAPPEKGCADVSGCGNGLEAWARGAKLSRESSVGCASIRPVEKSWACACKSRLARPTFRNVRCVRHSGGKPSALSARLLVWKAIPSMIERMVAAFLCHGTFAGVAR